MKIMDFFRTLKFSSEKLVGFFKPQKTEKESSKGFIKVKNNVNNDYLDLINSIKTGNLAARKDFTDKHKGFISETISHALGKSTIPKNSPEFDIGLEAFDHSIDLFTPGKDKDFLSFSEQIIKDWVLSYIRDSKSSLMYNQITEEKYYLYSNYESTKDISEYKMSLWEYGIKLRDLPYSSPDDKQNIGTCVRIAKKLANDSSLFEKVIKSKNLSSEDFTDKIKLDKKIFNKHKKYIIALTLILKGDLKLLSSYLKNVYLRNDFTENIGVILEINNDQAIIFTLQGEFLTLKLNKSNKVGEQVRFGSYRVQKKNIHYKYIVAAWAVTSLMICFAIYQGLAMLTRNKTLTDLDSQSIPLANNTQLPNTTSANTPNSTNNSAIADVTLSPDIELTATPSAKITPKKATATAKPTVKPTPSPVNTKVAVATPTPAITSTIPSPTVNQSNNTTAPATTAGTTKATGVPGEVRISAVPYKVKVGSKYTIHFYMKSGNNGTMLILYENGKEHSRYPDTDETPNPQAKIVELQADTPGTYTYWWELVNEYGSTSSQMITVTVYE